MLDTIYTRKDVGQAKGHMARTAERIMASHPALSAVEVHRRGDGIRGAVARPGVAIYLAASRGTRGRSSETRIHPDDRAAERATREQEARGRLLQPYEGLSTGCFRIEEHRGRVMLFEAFHDIGGGMGEEVDSPSDAAERIAELQPGHERVYHAPAQDSGLGQPSRR